MRTADENVAVLNAIVRRKKLKKILKKGKSVTDIVKSVSAHQKHQKRLDKEIAEFSDYDSSVPERMQERKKLLDWMKEMKQYQAKDSRETIKAKAQKIVAKKKKKK